MPLDGMRILLVFGEAMAAPEVTWSLQDANADVVIAFREGSRSPVRRLRGITKIDVANPSQSFDAAREDLEAVLESGDIDAVMPLEDPALVLLESIETGTPRVGPVGSQCGLAIDKRQQFEIAERVGFRVPAWQSWPDLDRSGAEPLDHDGLVVVKPALAGWTAENRFDRGSIWFAQDRQAALRDLENTQPSSPMMVQRAVTGVGQGIFGVGDGRRCYSLSGHRRVRMMNPAGSGSSACVSRTLNADEIESARRFIADSEWSGLFMLETLQSKDGKVDWFMELNGRPWGSLALARRQGLEYPAWSAEFQLNETVPPDRDGQAGLTCRNLGREIMHGLHLLKGNRGNAPNWPRWSERFGVLGWSPKHCWYNSSRRQPSFLLKEAAHTVGSRLFRKSRG